MSFKFKASLRTRYNLGIEKYMKKQGNVNVKKLIILFNSNFFYKKCIMISVSYFAAKPKIIQPKFIKPPGI